MEWPFNETKNSVSATSLKVVYEGHPVLKVEHRTGDLAWLFTCGTTDRPDDMLLISMEDAMKRDPSLFELADLPLGWTATRDHVGDAWQRREGASS